MLQILLKERGAFGNMDTGGSWMSSIHVTTGDKPKEGEDDVKSSCPLFPWRHTCYNGGTKGHDPIRLQPYILCLILGSLEVYWGFLERLAIYLDGKALSLFLRWLGCSGALALAIAWSLKFLISELCNMMGPSGASGSRSSEGTRGRGFSLTDLFGSSSPGNTEADLNQPAQTFPTLVNPQRLLLLSPIIPYRRMGRGAGSSMIAFP
ncbi:hypothetical protein HAX54_051630 [Datura stramonium]|uniref:Uncharacterized protein n=1 Tax=Datura stramonium TaxID=4076 RepID=A0ABS8SXW0_DATST|nr:hypothetical protein [Datura stramonium]